VYRRPGRFACRKSCARCPIRRYSSLDTAFCKCKERVGIVIVASLLLLAHLARGQSCKEPDANVLILGAGMAGIAAAKTLDENGVTNFVILEACEEFGGRMRSAEI